MKITNGGSVQPPVPKSSSHMRNPITTPRWSLRPHLNDSAACLQLLHGVPHFSFAWPRGRAWTRLPHARNPSPSAHFSFTRPRRRLPAAPPQLRTALLPRLYGATARPRRLPAAAPQLRPATPPT